ncbi:hypothetical protein R5R35_014527 [Gryllus longicercus]|uniref:Rho-GAP domain-containing protein n=1 Tax=Gryllus longicercus TaxID=2509291 RepID=A0AAN9V6I5_9ORTH
MTFPPAYSDSDSEWSSLERRQRAADIYCKVNRKPTPHKRIRKKRTAIPVPTPRVPPIQAFVPPEGAAMLNYQLKEEQSRGGCDSSEKVHSETPSDVSDISEPELSSSATQSRQKYQKHSMRLKKKSGSTTLAPVGPPVVPNPSELRGHPYVPHLQSDNDVLSSKIKMDVSYGIGHDDESSLDVSSPRDVNSPMVKEGDKTSRRKDKQKVKADEKQEKRRIKEEKLKKLADKEKEREKKRAKAKVKSSPVVPQVTLQDFAQSKDNYIPLILEKCVKFIEEEGLDSEGIYRVPGNRAHVDLLFQKFEEDPNFNIHDLDIPVNAVATALKDFFSKRLPPLLTREMLAELEDISGARRINKQVSTAYLNLEVITDRSCRLLALRGLLKKLPGVNFEVLKFIFQHFVKVSENCKLNSMDSKNLAICWWPTLLPIEFSDMGRFEQMRPHLEDIVQTMIDQYPFLFCGKEAFVMV